MEESPVKSSVVADEYEVHQARRVGRILPGILTFLILFAASWSLLTAGSGELNFSLSDDFFFLNSAWRILNGQIPHNDFSLSTGTSLSYLTALGMLIRGPYSGSIAAGQAVLGSALGLLSFLILRRRTCPSLAAVGALFCALLVMATRQPGEALNLRSHAFFYNRVAEGFLAPLIWILFLPPIKRDRGITPIESFIVGLLLVLLAFTKISYALSGVALLGLAFILGRTKGKNLLILLASIVFSSFALVFATGISPSAWWRDVTTPFRIGYQVSQEYRILACSIKGLPYLAIMLALVAALWKRLSPREALRLALINIACWGLAVMAAIASQQRQEYLLPIAALLITLEVRRRLPPRINVWRALVLAFVGLAIGLQLIRDGGSLISSWRSAQRPRTQETYFSAPGLTDFRMAPIRVDTFTDINDGILLVEQNTAPDTPVLTLGYADPIAFALHRTPPAGGVTFWYPDFNFNAQLHPDPALVFRGNPWILLTRYQPYEARILEVYGRELETRYQPAATSAHYRLFKPIHPQD